MWLKHIGPITRLYFISQIKPTEMYYKCALLCHLTKVAPQDAFVGGFVALLGYHREGLGEHIAHPL